MKSYKTLILSVVLLALLSVAVYQIKMPPAAANDSDSTAVISISPNEDLTGLVFYNRDDYTTLRRRGGVWKMETPFTAPADAQKIETFARTSFNLHYIRKLTDGISDPASFGLKDRSRFCILSYSSGRSDTLFLGGTTPAGSWYLQKNAGKEIYTVAREFGEYFQRTPAQWRMLRLGDWPVFGISAFTVKTPAGDIRFAKDSLDLSWEIQRPRKWPGNHPAIVGLLRMIFETPATEIRPIGSRPPRGAYHVEVENDQGGRMEFLAWPGTKECAVLSKAAGEIYMMPAEFGAGLSRDWNYYRDCRIIRAVSADSISRVVIGENHSSLTITRQDSGQWTLSQPKGAPANEKAVEEFVSGLAALNADSVSDAKKDLAQSGRKLEVTLEGRHFGRQEILFVVSGIKTHVYTDGARFAFNTDVIGSLWKGMEHFGK